MSRITYPALCDPEAHHFFLARSWKDYWPIHWKRRISNSKMRIVRKEKQSCRTQTSHAPLKTNKNCGTVSCCYRQMNMATPLNLSPCSPITKIAGKISLYFFRTLPLFFANSSAASLPDSLPVLLTTLLQDWLWYIYVLMSITEKRMGGARTVMSEAFVHNIRIYSRILNLCLSQDQLFTFCGG